MKSFELYEPTTVSEAAGLLTRFGATGRPLGGGSDLVTGVMKDWVQGKGMPYPQALVDLTTIPELHGITVGADGARIGATTTLAEVVENQQIQTAYPMLADAAHSVASPLIRNFGTVGGNINQRPRCWFFRGENFACYKKGGDFCYAVTGDNRFHAIIGGELCYIVHPSDTSTALLALNASATVVDGSGAPRAVPFDNYFIGPREDVLRENVLKPGEIMTEVKIPSLPAGTRQGWEKLKDRQVYDFAIVSVAVQFTEQGGVWQDGRVALGGVSPVPYRAKVVEDALKGKDIRQNVRQAAAQVRTVARPMSLNAYKVDMVTALIERVILKSLG